MPFYRFALFIPLQIRQKKNVLKTCPHKKVGKKLLSTKNGNHMENESSRNYRGITYYQFTPNNAIALLIGNIESIYL